MDRETLSLQSRKHGKTKAIVEQMLPHLAAGGTIAWVGSKEQYEVALKEIAHVLRSRVIWHDPKGQLDGAPTTRVDTE